ncbi:hypothetical protein GCM10010975_12940 [Comamonas phosphati]|nr:hypothetical protein GCM10010975_12940 [Comamonas phosphati]
MSAPFVGTSQPTHGNSAMAAPHSSDHAASSLAANACVAGVDSTVLLNGQKAVTIVHNGTPYRLQATKLGKLILTK